MNHSIPLEAMMEGVVCICLMLFAIAICVAMWRGKDKDYFLWSLTGITTFLTVAVAIYMIAKANAWFTAHILYLP
jgi:hypothetical protein